MNIQTSQTIEEQRAFRRASVKGLEVHADGQCVHVGKISPACRTCFTHENHGAGFGGAISIGEECNTRCGYCYYDKHRKNPPIQQVTDGHLIDLFRKSLSPSFAPYVIAYQSRGETLIYLKNLLITNAIIESHCSRIGITPYRYLYTNGMLMDQEAIELMLEMGINEVRVHWSASNFSGAVLENMTRAGKAGITISIEEPSLPSNTHALLSRLSIMNDIGVRHLNLIEVQVTPYNIDYLMRNESAPFHIDLLMHLCDEGLVYSIMNQRNAKGYAFSVLDCNSEVERSRHNPSHFTMPAEYRMRRMESMDEACTSYDFGPHYVAMRRNLAEEASVTMTSRSEEHSDVPFPLPSIED